MNRSSFSRLLKFAGALAFGLVLLAPASASAASLSFQPPTTPTQSDLQDLDHLYMYAWRIQGLNSFISSGTTINSATITISNIVNWDANPNHLFMHLLDTTKIDGTTNSASVNTALEQIGNEAVTGGTDNGFVNGAQKNSASQAGASQVYRYQDNGGDNLMIDDFARDNDGVGAGAGYQTVAGSQFLGTTNGVGNTALGSDENVAGDNPNATAYSGWIDHGNGMLLYEGWADENTTSGYGADGRSSSTLAQGGTSASDSVYSGFKSFDTTGGTYTYTFSAAELVNLKAYIIGNNAGSGINSAYGDIALALDPDCHFFNDNISFTIDYTNQAAAAVPEPASLALLGTGLAGLAGLSRRRKKAKQSKTVVA